MSKPQLGRPVTEINREKLLKALEAVKDKVPARMLPPELRPKAIDRTSRAVAIAALFLLKVSYGQLMTLFGVAQSTVYDAVSRHIPFQLRQQRKRAGAKPHIPHEKASVYYAAVETLPAYTNSVLLAAKLSKIATDPEWSEEDENDPYLHNEAGDRTADDSKG